jgi:hypothetical protein
MLNRREFNETFTGADLTIQVRGAIDFAQQHDLAFARSTGDQAFLFSRLPKASKQERNHPANERRRGIQSGNQQHRRPNPRRRPSRSK